MRYIKNKFGDIIFCIRDDGTITDKFDCDTIGHLKHDRITDKFDIDTLYRIRPDGTITDKYDCDIIGHIREDVREDGTISPDSGSDTGILGAIFSLICVIIIAILKIIPYLYAYFMIPLLASTTIYCCVGTLLFGVVGLLPISLAFGVADSILFFISIPYWFILFIQKHKQKLKWKQVFKYYGLWFLKGPYAYKDIKALKNQIKNGESEK